MQSTKTGVQIPSVTPGTCSSRKKLSIPVHNSSLVQVRQLIRQVYAESSLSSPEDDDVMARVCSMELAATELVSNVIRHGFPSDSMSVLPERSCLNVQVFMNNASQLVFQLTHNGDSFEGNKVEIREITEPQEGGMGLFLISQCVDHVAYACPMPGRNFVWLISNLKDNS